MLKSLILITSLTLLPMVLPAQSPKAAAERPAPRAASPAKSTLFVSHVKQIGSIGTFEVHQIKIRGLDCPNLSAAVIRDPASGAIQIIGPATGAGLAHSIVQAGGNVGAAAVFGWHLRPNHETINNGSAATTSASAAGTATANTSNNNSSSGFTPPGQIDNPGHDGNPGNPH